LRRGGLLYGASFLCLFPCSYMVTDLRDEHARITRNAILARERSTKRRVLKRLPLRGHRARREDRLVDRRRRLGRMRYVRDEGQWRGCRRGLLLDLKTVVGRVGDVTLAAAAAAGAGVRTLVSAVAARAAEIAAASGHAVGDAASSADGAAHSTYNTHSL